MVNGTADASVGRMLLPFSGAYTEPEEPETPPVPEVVSIESLSHDAIEAEETEWPATA